MYAPTELRSLKPSLMSNLLDVFCLKINRHKHGILISSIHMVRSKDKEEEDKDKCHLGLDSLGTHPGMAARRTSSSKVVICRHLVQVVLQECLV